jgi:hypothetical protein
MEIDVRSRKPFTDILKALDEPNDDECIDIGKAGRGPTKEKRPLHRRLVAPSRARAGVVPRGAGARKGLRPSLDELCTGTLWRHSLALCSIRSYFVAAGSASENYPVFSVVPFPRTKAAFWYRLPHAILGAASSGSKNRFFRFLSHGGTGTAIRRPPFPSVGRPPLPPRPSLALPPDGGRVVTRQGANRQRHSERVHRSPDCAARHGPASVRLPERMGGGWRGIADGLDLLQFASRTNGGGDVMPEQVHHQGMSVQSTPYNTSLLIDFGAMKMPH